MGMGELIQFRASAGADRSRPAPTERQEARIIFFTGVRYQRHEPTELIEPNASSNSPPEGGMDGAGGGRRKRRG
jgi:hypothetical protein